MEPHVTNHGAHLLIVDDEPGIRLPLTYALRASGYCVEAAGHGQHALEKLKQQAYDLIVLDISLPDIDGLELLTHIHQHFPTLLVIILTGHTSQAATTIFLPNVVDFLLKPVGISELGQVIERALQQKKPMLHQKKEAYPPLETIISPAPETRPGPVPVAELIRSRRFIEVRPILLDCLKQLVTIKGTATCLELTGGETAVLAALMIHSDQVLSCRELVETTWGRRLEEPEAKSVIRPHIFRLRRKLKQVIKKPDLIRTVRKRGYHYVPAQTVSFVSL